MKDYIEIGKKISVAKTRHGLSRHKIHWTWDSMKQRCLDPNNKRWDRYGGRGIKVCDAWMVFDNFLRDMGLPPSKSHQLDRINNDGDYEPGNCRWVDLRQQANNKSTNVHLTYDGMTLTLTEWARRKGFNPQTLWARINTHGWSVERAISEPKRGT